MSKLKQKVAILLMVSIVFISTLSFATESEIQPRTQEDENTVTNEQVAEGENTETTEQTQEGENTVTNEQASEDENTVTEEQTGEEPTPEIHNGDLYLFNNDVVMDQYVDGNVFIMGSSVKITGRVNGSLYVMADKVTLEENAYIIQDLYIAANEISLNGAANDLYAIANKVDMSYDSFMIRDLRVCANTFNFNGGVGRDAFVTAKEFNFVTTADAGAIVYGNLNYSAPNELELSKDFVQGNVNYSKDNFIQPVQNVILDKVLDFCKTLIYTIAVFLLAIWLAPKFVKTISSYVGTKSILALGIGALASVIALVLSFALTFSYVGAPVAIAIFGLYLLMMSIAFAVTTTSITLKIKEKFKFEKKYLTAISLVLVTLILWGLTQIPYAGWVISLAISLVGFGITVLYLIGKNKKEKIEEK